MAEEKFGVEDIRKVLVLYADVKKWYLSSIEDGKITIDEYFQLLAEAKAIQDVIANAKAVKDQAIDLSIDEVKSLEKEIQALGGGNLPEIIEEILVFLVAGKAVVARIMKSKAE